MPGGQVTVQQNSNNTRYVTIVFNYEESKIYYDTLNNFIAYILQSVNNYNSADKPNSSSTRYNLEEIFTSMDKPYIKDKKEETSSL